MQDRKILITAALLKCLTNVNEVYFSRLYSSSWFLARGLAHNFKFDATAE